MVSDRGSNQEGRADGGGFEMKVIDKSRLRRLIIQESYNLSLMQQLYEQTTPTPTDPTASADPTAAAPAADPTAPADPTAVPTADPTAAATPAVDPTAAPAVDPTAAAVADPTAAAAPPAPGAPPTPSSLTKKSFDPDKDPVKDRLQQALDRARGDAKNNIATESLRKKSLLFLVEQEGEKPQFNLRTYAREVANLINNYTSLVDVKKIVIDQAEANLDDEFPKGSDGPKRELRDLLRTVYHISLERPETPPDSYAVGATEGGSGGAA